jgi:septal ring factor EnvC (AmiA/AmiB activator)
MEADMFKKIFYIASGLFLSVTLLGSMGLGTWTYNLNNKLEQSQTDYKVLQGDYNKLDSEYSQAKADYESSLDKTQAELEDAQAELEDAQAQIKRLERDLDEAHSENKSLNNRVSAIQSKVAVLNAFWFTSESAFADRVENSDDEQLKKLYKSLDESQSWDAFVELMSYLIQSISEASGISWQPVENVNAVLIGQTG